MDGTKKSTFSFIFFEFMWHTIFVYSCISWECLFDFHRWGRIDSLHRDWIGRLACFRGWVAVCFGPSDVGVILYAPIMWKHFPHTTTFFILRINQWLTYNFLSLSHKWRLIINFILFIRQFYKIYVFWKYDFFIFKIIKIDN